MTAAIRTNVELKTALPTRRLLISLFAGSAALMVGWIVAAAMAGWSPEIRAAGVAGTLVVAMVNLFSVLVISPWKSRAISEWMTFWLGATVLRLLVTPALAFVLYSATSLNATALTLSVASAYLAMLMTEALIVSRHIAAAAPVNAAGALQDGDPRNADSAGRPARQGS